ncbi:hypothetical protein JCM6882_007414 [Rhodosporidiobolus microsporus]
MSLPAVPPGTNPFTVYYDAVHTSFSSNPPEGFKVRLGVLFGLTGLVIILAIVNWVLLVLEAKRHKRGSPYWLFRLHARQSGRYIVTNGKLTLSLFTVITGAVMIGTQVDLWNVFVEQKSQSRSSIIRTFAVLPLLLQGWLMPFAALQASLLASDQGDSNLMPAWLANTLFAGVGTIIFLGVVASGVVNSQAGQAVWNQADKVLHQLKDLEAAWTPGQNTFPALLTLQPEFTELQKRVNRNRNVQLVCISTWIVIPVLVILVSLASLRLSRLLHRQVQFNIEQFVGPLGTETQLSRRSNGSNGNVRPGTAMSMNGNGGEKERKDSVATKHGDSLLPIAHTHTHTHSNNTPRGSTTAEGIRQKLRDGRMSISHLSRGDLMKLANRRASAPDRERIRNIQALQKAEKDLVVTSYVVLVAICAILGICIYFLYTIASNSLATAGWATFEATLTATAWIYDIALGLVLSSLIWFHWQARLIRPGSEGGTTLFGQPTLANADPLMSVNSNGNGAGVTGQRRGTVTIDLGGGVIGMAGGGLQSGSGLHAPQLSSLSQQTSKDLDSYSWGPRDGEAEVLRIGSDEEGEGEAEAEGGERPVAVDRRDSGRMSPTMRS